MRLRSAQRAAGPERPSEAGDAEQAQHLSEALALDEAAAAAVTQHRARTGQSFGEAAVDVGVATPEQVRRVVEARRSLSVLQADDQRIDPVVVSAFDPDDRLTLSVRSLRALIMEARRTDGGALQSVALLGLDTGAETPVLAANLAVAFAQAGYRTLLVDADLVNPQHHALFRLDNGAGLGTMLATEGRAEPVAQATAIAGLSVIPSGPRAGNASALLNRGRVAAELEQVLDEFDLILVDSGDDLENAISASLGLDGVIITVRRDITETRLLSRVVGRLEAGGVTVLGSILVE